MKHLRTLAALFGALVLSAIAAVEPASATVQYNSNNSSTGFDATTSGSAPAGWVNGTGTWVASTTPAVIASHTNGLYDSSATNNSVAVFTGTSSIADMDVTSTQAVTISGGKATTTGLVARYNSTGNTGYACVVSVGGNNSVTVILYKEASGTFTAIGSTSTIAYTISGSSDTINLRFNVQGSNLRCRAWSASTVEPTAYTVSNTDSAVTAAGYAGVFNGQTVAGQHVGLTDFAVNDTPPGETNAILTYAPAPIGPGGTVSGIFSGTAPTGLAYALDGATTFTATSSPTIGNGTFSFPLPSVANGYHQLTVQATNATTETSTTPAILVSPGTAVAPNSAGIFYSPYNWTAPTTTVASTINAGAYFKTLYTGVNCSLNFGVANQSATYPSEIYYRVDGYEAQTPWVKANVAASVSCSPSANTSNSNYAYHLLEVVVKSTSQNVTRWSASSASAVNFTGLTLGAAASVVAPSTYPKRCLIYGDSRTEGVRTINQTASNDADQNDVLNTWDWQVAEHLDCEFGIVGFGSQGVVATGSGSVPALPSSYALVNAGVGRSFSIAPDLVIEEMGANDSGQTAAAYQSAESSFLSGILAATPSTTKVAVLGDFSGYQNAASQAAVAASGSGRVSYVDMTGVFTAAYGADTLNLHPTGANDSGLMAPQIATKLQGLFTSSQAAFRSGFH